MPATPTQNGQTYSNVNASGSSHIDDLLVGTKWGAGTGTGVELSFSFPSGSASWAPNYSNDNEPATWSALDVSAAAQVRDALQTWANVANINFTEVTESPTQVGDLRFAYSGSVDASGYAGWAYYPGSTPAAGDVWLAHGVNNFALTVLHEIGHTLGLSHPGDTGTNPDYTQQYSIMSYNSHPHALYREVTYTGNSWSYRLWEVKPDTPMLYDIAAIQYLYGANMSYHTGDDVYAFDPDVPFFRTIWDAGGNDTISVENFTKGCEIDLRAGFFSSITIESDPLPPGASGGTVPTYYGQDNLAIAFNVVIENATGGAGDDYLMGNNVANILTGNAGNDTLLGNAGGDTLDGGAGNDTMKGGAGNDTYIVDSAGDVTNEPLNGGIDTVLASVSRTLGANQEKLVLTGSEAINGTGNTLSNVLTGNGANNTLTGLGGNDTLNGGGGSDILKGGTGSDVLTGGPGTDFFLFNAALNAAGNVDTLTDFTTGVDKIRLDDDIFTAFDATVSSKLTAIELYVASGATAAQDAFDKIIYNTSTGYLYYDADGVGGGGAVPFAILGTSTHPALVANDFQIVV